MRLSQTIMSSSALPLPHRCSFTTTTSFAQSNHTYSSTPVNNKAPLASPHLDQQCSSQDSIKRHFDHGFPQKPKTIRYRFSQLCKEGQIHVARQLFDSIPQPTTVLWNAIIIGYICNDLHHEAIALYSKMMKSSSQHQPDPYTFSSVLKACAETKELRIGKAVHCHILRSCIYAGRIVYNSLLNMYATCLSSFDALYSCDLVKRVFSTMPKRNVVAWNTMISWYLKTERPVEGLVHFVMMLKMGIKPTPVSFVNVFPATSRVMDVQIAHVLYGMVIKFGDEYVNDLFVVSSAIYMYAELGCLADARRIFDHCLERNIEIWNSLIGGCVQNNCAIEALHLFLEALQAQDDVGVDDVTFLSALTATSQLQSLGFAQQLHASLIKNSLVSHAILQNAIVSTYSKCNSISESFRVFNGMQERDIVSWNTMVSALVQNGMDVEGLMLVHEMQSQKFMIDGVTIAAVLSAASNLRNLDIGKQTHAYLIRHRIQFEGMNTYLIDMYAKSGMMKAAQAVFNMNCSKDRDPAMWNAMISANTHNGLIEKSFAVLRQMLELDLTPTAVTLASILPACSQSGSLALGKAIHGFAIRNFLDDNVFVGSALVDMYSKSGAIHYAESVFEKSPNKNSITYTNMIVGYGQHGMGDKAILLFNAWRGSGFQPDGVPFLAALSACSYSGLITEGLQIFESMRDHEVQPSLEHYACVVDMLGRVGRVVEAYMFADEIDEECNVLGIWGSLLAACRIHKNFELGKVVADKLLALAGGDKTTGYHVLLSNIYAAEGNWEYVNRVRRGMREKGLTKEVGCSWINISGVAHCFASKDEAHPVCCEIYEMLGYLSTNMKDAGYSASLRWQEVWISEFGE
nr:pentatricopeptide repeat-containing protein At3g22150, chloroplastic-like [Coffea arabica]XP_027097429.1 pentatricopeptide repeat-containing protein At3g22150, chloroplastic-like [Coffea arabica]XP_027097430.1 pentatricopeptide repeat-containing protein At3g22150, chloroplastic-like [Coffea arabica]XP_027097431.1 pentatricopeptide repeat-containing protein At3g22150, chloroplastic-like [Coffea arabica]XP_027097433.1 pentatricopeptide repeat-containing protein At3g22150, chloroplastic-like [C